MPHMVRQVRSPTVTFSSQVTLSGPKVDLGLRRSAVTMSDRSIKENARRAADLFVEHPLHGGWTQAQSRLFCADDVPAGHHCHHRGRPAARDKRWPTGPGTPAVLAKRRSAGSPRVPFASAITMTQNSSRRDEMSDNRVSRRCPLYAAAGMVRAGGLIVGADGDTAAGAPDGQG